jgi:hypothetical protein
MQQYGMDMKIVYHSQGNISELKAAKTSFIFIVPYHLLLNPDTIYKIKLPGADKIYTIQAISRTAYTADFNHKLFGLPYDDNLKGKAFYTRAGDRFGITGYTTLSITTNRCENVIKKSGELDNEKVINFIERCCTIYNYFLDRYAAVTRHRQLSKIAPFDLHTLSVVYSDINDEKLLFEVHLSALHELTLMNAMPSPPETVNERLQELLLNNEFNLDSLGVQAVRSVYSGDYMDGIVKAVTQLEAFLYRLFRKMFNSKSVEKVDEKLKAIGLSGLVDMLPLVIDDQTFQTMAKTIKLDVIKGAITKRNNFIHEGVSAGVNTLFDAEAIIDEINHLCVELAKLCGVDHMMDSLKTGWR